MLTEQDEEIVKKYFSVFTPMPSVYLDSAARHEDESYILIEGGGLSVGKFLDGAGRPYYTVHNEEGDEVHKDVRLDGAVKEAMLRYTKELFRRTADKYATAEMAEEYNTNRELYKNFRS